MKKWALSSILFAFLSFSAFSFSPDTELVPSGHWIYDALDYLYADVGEANIAVYAPASHFEIRTCLDAIPLDRLSPQGLSLYRKVLSSIGERTPVVETGAASFDTRPAVSLSARLRATNDAFFAFDRTADFNATKPLVSLPLELCFTPYVTGYSDLTLGEGYLASGLANNYTNIPNDASYVDMNWPKTAYLSAGNSFCTAVVGRGALSYGNTYSGSMLLSDSADRLDYASLSFFTPHVRYTMLPVELAPNRFAYYHSLTFKPVGFLSVTFSEGSTVNSTLDLRYLNPFMVFHNYAGWNDGSAYGHTGTGSPVGTQLGAELSVVPYRGVRVYGQFVMNQFQTSYELENWPDSAVLPNALGGTVGARYSIPIFDGFLAVTAEGVYSNPWLYIMDNKSISWYWSRNEQVMPSGYGNTAVSGWLGSPYGPDTIACVLNARYDDAGNFGIGATYRLVNRGENGDLFLAYDESASGKAFYPGPTERDRAIMLTPSGNASLQHMVRLDVSKYIGSNLEFSGFLGYAAMSGKISANAPFCGLGATWNVR